MMCYKTSQCPKCGKFTSEIYARINEFGISKVVGTCKIHGEVDISDGGWAYEDFDNEFYSEEEP
jgi:hypothetical protein